MLHTVILLYPDVLLVADGSREQQARAVLLRLMSGEREELSSASLGIACFKAKEKHYIYTRHKNSMKRVLNHKILFQPQIKELSHP